MNTQGLAAETMVFRKTNTHVGRQISVSPQNSRLQHLVYGRIILNSGVPFVKFDTGVRETGLICLSGEADVSVDGEAMHLGKNDSIYISRDCRVEVSTGSSVDIAEISSDVAKKYPLQLVRYADVEKDPGLKFTTGTPGCVRHINMLLAKNVEAGRLIAGLTRSEPGNWTSWPPHEHAKLLEEVYIYVDMPHPAYGIQLVYNDAENPEFVTVVREGDAVLIPSGYHPNVAVPGHSIGFLWAMAAHREGEDRQYGVVNVQPEFNQGRSGLEAGKKS